MRRLHAALLCAGCIVPPLAAQASPEEADLALAFGDSSTVSIATGARQLARRAPAVTSVITAEDIQAMGATDLREALSLVPGLNIARSFYFYDPQYEFRGVWSSFSSQVLLLIDGVRRQSAFFAGVEDAWVSMPVGHIARIEVIRGPGSALYGADAMAGVISITTKKGAELGAGRLSLEAGSYASRSASWQQGWRWGELELGMYLRRGRSAGPDEIVAEDVQTGLDAVFGSHASLAPGPLQMPHEASDAALNLAWGGWHLNSRYKDRWLGGTAQGLANALGRDSYIHDRLYVAELGYQRSNWRPDWDLQLSGSLSREWISSHLQLFPPGAFGGSFPQGLIGEPRRTGRQLGLEAIASYQGMTGHRWRIGLGWGETALLRTGEGKNFDNIYVPGVGAQLVNLGPVQESDPATLYITPHARQVRYALLQDEWQFAPDWTLTAGLRHDRYSDFGSTTNPRLALVWDAAYNLTLKLLHGQAFRAPSFQELYNNNFIARGNPAVRPERMRTSEVVLDWQASQTLQMSVNLFRYTLRDTLRFAPNPDPSTGATAANEGGQQGHGGEWETRWAASKTLNLSASLSYQRARDTLVQADAGASPHLMLKLALDGRLGPAWRWHAQARRIAGRLRPSGDARPPIADYNWVDAALHWSPPESRQLGLTLGLQNVFNVDARDPSPSPGAIRDDLPLPRRNWALQAHVQF